MTLPESYEAAANALGARILALIPEHQEILTLTNPFDLFKVPGFVCADMKPTLAQAQAAIAWARRTYAEARP